MFEKSTEEDVPLRNHLDLWLVLPLKKIKMQSHISLFHDCLSYELSREVIDTVQLNAA